MITREIYEPHGFIDVPANIDIRSIFVLPMSFRGCRIGFGGCIPS